jgi:hypothetical protein
MSDKEPEDRLDLMEKRIHERLDLIEKAIHERFDHIHRRHRRIQNYLAAAIGLIIVLMGLLAWSWYVPAHP